MCDSITGIKRIEKDVEGEEEGKRKCGMRKVLAHGKGYYM